ncbi:MAG: hypothetical protein ACO3C1_03855 [Ilumatobacteraceae bacterium]
MTTVDAATARREADTAAADAGVVIRAVATPDELDVLRATMESVWGAEIVPPRNLLRGLALGGACLLLASDATSPGESPVGFALGWLGWFGGMHFHSHQVGVRSGLRGGGVGYALKLTQRAVCLEHGVAEMRWTFDPMLLSNARFNLGRLGAVPLAFLEHCYGDRRDAFNTGERTDRLEVSWQLDVGVGPSIDRVRHVLASASAVETIEVPLDYASLRASDPGSAAQERARVGAALGAAFATGAHVMLRDDTYLVVRP